MASVYSVSHRWFKLVRDRPTRPTSWMPLTVRAWARVEVDCERCVPTASSAASTRTTCPPGVHVCRQPLRPYPLRATASSRRESPFASLLLTIEFSPLCSGCRCRAAAPQVPSCDCLHAPLGCRRPRPRSNRCSSACESSTGLPPQPLWAPQCWQPRSAMEMSCRRCREHPTSSTPLTGQTARLLGHLSMLSRGPKRHAECRNVGAVFFIMRAPPRWWPASGCVRPATSSASTRVTPCCSPTDPATSGPSCPRRSPSLSHHHRCHPLPRWASFLSNPSSQFSCRSKLKKWFLFVS
jgi:hypothetical protein